MVLMHRFHSLFRWYLLYYSNAVNTVRVCRRIKGWCNSWKVRLLITVCLFLGEKREMNTHWKDKVRTFILCIPWRNLFIIYLTVWTSAIRQIPYWSWDITVRKTLKKQKKREKNRILFMPWPMLEDNILLRD